ncbi:zinc knuckle CX2CX4HX4C containing protein [Tanacetum coccineum]
MKLGLILRGNDENDDVMENKLDDEMNKTGDLNARYDDYSGIEDKKSADIDSVSLSSDKKGLDSDKECLDDDDQEVKQDEIRLESSGKSMLNYNKKNESENSSHVKTYAHVTMNLKDSINNHLRSIPTVLNDLGEEVVVFDEEMVKLGSKKMWARYGFKEIIDNGNGRWLFKFNKEEGLSEVVAKSPWIVNGKPLIVYKWDPEIRLDRIEPKVLPVWVKLVNMPMKA